MNINQYDTRIQNCEQFKDKSRKKKRYTALTPNNTIRDKGQNDDDKDAIHHNNGTYLKVDLENVVVSKDESLCKNTDCEKALIPG